MRYYYREETLWQNIQAWWLILQVKWSLYRGQKIIARAEAELQRDAAFHEAAKRFSGKEK